MTPYRVWVTPNVFKQIKALPGQIRQRVRRAVSELAEDPRPSDSKILRRREQGPEVRRLRLDQWRIVYVIAEEDRAVDVVGVRKRPPYDYGDLDSLIQR